jgi:hypothetical protein
MPDQNPDWPPPPFGDVVVVLLLVVSVLVSEVPRPVWPPPVGVVSLVVLVVTALVPPPPPEFELLDELELDPEEVPPELDVVDDFGAVAVEGEAVPVVGTVSSGAPVVLPALEPPLPQAASATPASIAAAADSNERLPGSETLCRNPTPNRRDDRLTGNRIHPLPAPRAVEQILLRQLVAMAAET